MAQGHLRALAGGMHRPERHVQTIFGVPPQVGQKGRHFRPTLRSCCQVRIPYYTTEVCALITTSSWSLFRSLFGPSVGPVAKPVPQTGRVQNVFEGVKVRSQPLPLKIPSNQPQPVVQAQQPSQIIQPQPFLQVGGGSVGAAVTSVSSVAGASAGGGSIVHIAGAHGNAGSSGASLQQRLLPAGPSPKRWWHI